MVVNPGPVAEVKQSVGFFIAHPFFKRCWPLILINGFYSVVALTLMGVIIGMWR